MGGKPGPFSRFLAAGSGLFVAISVLFMMFDNFLPGLVLSTVLVVIWILFMRFLTFMSETGELDVSPMLEEIRTESALEALYNRSKPGPGRENPALNPQRILGANDRALVKSTPEPKHGRTKRSEPNPEAEDDRAWAEMMRVL